MAYYLTGRQRTLTASGVITGHGHSEIVVEPTPPNSIKACECHYEVRMPFAPVAADVYVTGSVVGSVFGGSGITVYANNGQGDTDTDTNVPQGTPYDADGAGTWEISIDVEEVIEVGAHPSNDASGMPNYGGSVVDDLPVALKYTLYERTKAGGTATATITIGGITATATGAIDAAVNLSGLASHYPIYRYVYADATWYTVTAGCTCDFLGLQETAYTHSSGYVSCTSTTVTAATPKATQQQGTLESTVCPPKGLVISGTLRSDTNAWPGAGDVRLLRKSGESYHTISAADGWGHSYTQSDYEYGATLNGSAQAALSAVDWSPVECWLIPTAPDTSNEWRMLLHGWQYDALDIAQAANVNVDGSYSVALGDTEVRVLATQSLNGYRYLEIATGAAGATFTLAIGAKSWDLTADGTGLATVDLCSPTNAAVDTDTLTQRWEWPIDVDTVAGNGCLWGCERVTGYTISGGSAAFTVPANGVRLIRANHALLTIMPEFDSWHADGATVDRRQFVVGDTDGRRSYENEDGYVSSGTPQQDTIKTFSDEVELVEAGYVRHQGWTCAMKAAIDVADGADGTDILNNYLNRQRPATWLFGAGCLWDATTDPAAWRYGCDLDAASTLTVPAQALFDRVEWYPGCGDVFGLRAGAHRYEYAAADGTNGAIELRAHRILRSAVTGIALNRTTGRPVTGATVAVLEATSHDPYGSGTTDIRGEYLTGLPYAYHDAAFDVQLQIGAPRPEATCTLYSRSRQRVAFRGLPVGAGLSYDVSEGLRHVRAFIDAGTIWLQAASTVPPTVWDGGIDTGIAADDVCIRFARRSATQPLWIAYVNAGTVYLSYTLDEGRACAVAISVGSGDHPGLVCCPDGLMGAYRVDGAAIKGILYTPAGAVAKAEFTAIASGVDDAAIAVDTYTGPGGQRGVALMYRSSGVLVTAVSTDAVAFA